MKTYTIGELLNSFTEPSFIGYSYKGSLKDRIIACDTDNENRLMWIKSNGEADYDFYFGVKDTPIEEAREFVFFHEMDEFPEIKNKITKCYLKAITSRLDFNTNQNEVDKA